MVILVTSTSVLVNLRALNETLHDGERTCICYDQSQNMLKRNRMSQFFKTRPQYHNRTMKIPQKTGYAWLRHVTMHSAPAPKCLALLPY
jgi:hypothetical protein